MNNNLMRYSTAHTNCIKKSGTREAYISAVEMVVMMFFIKNFKT